MLADKLSYLEFNGNKEFSYYVLFFTRRQLMSFAPTWAARFSRSARPLRSIWYALQPPSRPLFLSMGLTLLLVSRSGVTVLLSMDPLRLLSIVERITAFTHFSGESLLLSNCHVLPLTQSFLPLWFLLSTNGTVACPASVWPEVSCEYS